MNKTSEQLKGAIKNIAQSKNIQQYLKTLWNNYSKEKKYAQKINL